MSRKTLLSVLAILILLGAGATWYFTRSSSPVSTGTASSTPEQIGADEPHTLGNPSAKVTLIEYGALACPYCARFSQEIFPALKVKYIDTGKVFYVYRLFPIGPADYKAERIAMCLPKSQYFAFVDLLYRRQADWGPEQHNENGTNPNAQPQTDAGLLQMARVAGLGTDRARVCMADKSVDTRIDQVAQEGQQRYPISGLPTLIVNGQAQPSGIVPLDRLSQIIDPLLK